MIMYFMTYFIIKVVDLYLAHLVTLLKVDKVLTQKMVMIITIIGLKIILTFYRKIHG